METNSIAEAIRVEAALPSSDEDLLHARITLVATKIMQDTTDEPVAGDVVTGEWDAGLLRLPDTARLAKAIAGLTQTRAWAESRENGDVLVFLGFPGDVELATALMERIHTDVMNGWESLAAQKGYDKEPFPERRKRAATYIKKRIDRINLFIKDVVGRLTVEIHSKGNHTHVIQKRMAIGKAYAERADNPKEETA